MFSFIGKMFGTDKAGEAIIDGVTSGIDKLWYTEEEKAEDAAQARREGMAVYMEWLKSTSGSRIARRLIALMITGSYFLQLTIAQALTLAAIWEERTILPDGTLAPSRLTEAASLLFSWAAEGGALVGVVLLFYFGGPAAIEASKGLITRWVAKQDEKKKQDG
jgi:hypothetical protein